MSLLGGQSMCCYAWVSCLQRWGGEQGRERKRAKNERESSPPTSVSHMGETVTGNSLLQQLQGEMIKEWRNANQRSSLLSSHTTHFFLAFFNSFTKYQKHRKVNSATGTAIPQESRDIYQDPYKQDLIGIKSYVAAVFSQQAEHGDSSDYLRYLGMLLS